MSDPETSKDEFFNEDVATFGDRLEAARRAKGVSTEQLAEQLGVKIETIESWENDVSPPRANKLQMLSGLLDVSIVWLMSGKGNGTHDVIEGYDRPDSVNETLAEIKTLKRSLINTVDRIEKLEDRLLDTT